MSLDNQTIPNNVHVAGHFTANTMAIPDGTVGDDAISDSATISADKTINRYLLTYQQPFGTAIVAATIPIYFCRAGHGATVNLVSATILGALATGSDRTVTIDVKRGTGFGTRTSILGAPLVLDIYDPAAAQEYVYSVPTLTAVGQDQSLILYVTVAGSSLLQAQGLLVEIEIDEQPI